MGIGKFEYFAIFLSEDIWLKKQEIGTEFCWGVFLNWRGLIRNLKIRYLDKIKRSIFGRINNRGIYCKFDWFCIVIVTIEDLIENIQLGAWGRFVILSFLYFLMCISLL